jgi:hypothetical protein
LRYSSACLLALLCLAAPAGAQQSEPGQEPARTSRGSDLELYTGVEYQSFELDGDQDAEKVSVPLTARLTTGRLHVTAQIPYLRVTAPGNVVVPSGPLGLPILVDPAGTAPVTTRDGLGDLRLGAAYDLPLPGVSASLSTGAKLSTASTAKGLGTGETDYWVGADVSKAFGPVVPFAGVQYTKTGDPEGAELRDTWAGQAGAAFRLGGSTSAHAGYSFSNGASVLSRDEQRVFGGVNTGLGGGVSLGVYGSAGVSGPADVGAGVSLGIGLR